MDEVFKNLVEKIKQEIEKEEDLYEITKEYEEEKHYCKIVKEITENVESFELILKDN